MTYNDPEPLAISVETQERRTIVRIGGELDVATAPALVEVLNVANGDIIVDLSELSFLDARGLAVFAHAHGRAAQRGDRLTVVNATGLARRVFELTALSHLLSGSDAP